MSIDLVKRLATFVVLVLMIDTVISFWSSGDIRFFSAEM